MSMSAELAFQYKKITSSSVLELLTKTGFASKHPDILLDGESVSWEDAFGKSNHPSQFRLGLSSKTESWSISLAAGRQHEISLLFIDGLCESVLEELVEMFSKTESFLIARLYDREYDRLQNSTSVNEYEAAGVDKQNLKLVSNGLPFPLEETVVDTSQNPGRRVLRRSFIECIGHKMWLSSDLVGKLSIDEEKLVTIGEIQSSDKGIRIVFCSTAFTSDTPSSVQNSIREIIYSAKTDQTGTT